MALPKIIDEIEKIKSDYLPLSGENLNGSLYLPENTYFIKGGCIQSINDEDYKSFSFFTKNEFSNIEPYITMRKIDSPSSDKGCIILNAGDGENSSFVKLFPNGDFIKDNDTIVSLKEKYVSGNNWYRVYSDGWIEQGGSFSSTTTINATTTQITFTTPFTKSINILGGFVKAKHSATYGQMWFQNGDTTLTGCVCSIVCYSSNGNVNHSISSGTCYWYACGY